MKENLLPEPLQQDYINNQKKQTQAKQKQNG